MSGWLVALRIAARQTRRAKARSLLVVALIALPVGALAGAGALYDTFRLTPAEQVQREIGAADAQVTWDYDGAVRQATARGDWTTTPARLRGEPATAEEVAALLPAGSTLHPRLAGVVRMPTAHGVGDVPWVAVDLAEPVAEGLAEVTTGRAPRPGEVALTATAAARTGLKIGDLLDAEGRSYRVVGTVRFPGIPGGQTSPAVPSLHDEVLLFHPGDHPRVALWRGWLVTTPQPLTWDDVADLNRHGVMVYARELVLTGEEPPEGALPERAALAMGVIVAGLAGVEVVLLAGSAFAVGARRRQREIALVAASGGSPAQLRRILLADGVVLGVLAAAVGVAVGVAAAAATRHTLGTYLFNALPGGFRVFPEALAGAAVFAVVTGVLAALVPAVTTARQDVVTALVGGRDARGLSRGVLVTGVVVVAVGVLVATGGAYATNPWLMVAGLAAGQIGLALCTPALIRALSPLGRRLPLTFRIALRDTGRNRSAAAPAIATVMAAVAGAVTVGVIMVSVTARSYADITPPYPNGTVEAFLPWEENTGGPSTDAIPRVEQLARTLLPVAAIAELRWASCPPGENCGVGVLVPESKRCPFIRFDPDDPMNWEIPFDLPADEQRKAARDPRCVGTPPPITHDVYVDDGPALAIISDAPDDAVARAQEALAAGAAVVSDPIYLDEDGQVTLVRMDYDGHGSLAGTTALRLPGHLLTGGTTGWGAVVSYATAERAGLAGDPGRLVVATTRMPTTAEEDAFKAAMQAMGGESQVWRGFRERPDPVLLLLGVAAGVTALGAVAVATGLAAADRRRDLTTLAAVGAAPRIRRGMALSEAGVIGGLGTLLGLASGLGSAVAIVVALNQRYAGIWPAPAPIPLTVPWLHTALLLVVPVMGMIGAALFTRSRLPVERRTT